VRYVLEGCVQRSGNRVRVNAELIDAETGAHLWTERFDRNTGNLLALQEEITRQIAVALNLELVDAEAARSTEHPDALDYIFRGRALYLGRLPTRQNYAEQISLYELALALDPGSVKAQSWLATVLIGLVLKQLTDYAAADMERAGQLVGRALAVSPRNPLAHYPKGQVLRAQRRPEEAARQYETVIALDRNFVTATGALASCKFFIGSIQETIPIMQQAIRLSPRDPYIGNWYFRIGQAHLLESRIEEAILWFEKACSANTEISFFHAYLASACALKGETDRASDELLEAQRLSRDDRYSSIARLKGLEYFGVPAIRWPAQGGNARGMSASAAVRLICLTKGRVFAVKLHRRLV
jgi:adenylate cyclase